MKLSQYHKLYELRIHFEYNEAYKGGGVAPDSFIELFYAVSYNGAMKTANAFVAVEEREIRKSANYIDIVKVTVTPVND
jgi:hypothetical protein